jgi:hypothetical protein
VYKDGFYRFDLFGVVRPRFVVGFDVHSRFLHNRMLFDAIHAEDWNSDTVRPIRANFVGSRDPQRRREILARIESGFSPSAQVDEMQKRWFWHVYSDDQPAALSQAEFLKVLSDSDFTLCPPGYSLVTHRPVEALLRGSIPVLNLREVDLYDLSLVDGVNCVAVTNDDWPGAMRRVIRLPETEIVKMRRNIQAMVAARVAYRQISSGICRRLEVDESRP